MFVWMHFIQVWRMFVVIEVHTNQEQAYSLSVSTVGAKTMQHEGNNLVACCKLHGLQINKAKQHKYTMYPLLS